MKKIMILMAAAMITGAGLTTAYAQAKPAAKTEQTKETKPAKAAHKHTKHVKHEAKAEKKSQK
ncbi:hypothetical protein ACWKWU_00040 [Chitinophaga lutea]